MTQQTGPDIWQALIGLLPVVVGSMATLLGIVLGPIVTHFLTSRKEQAEYRAKRFEEMMAVIHRHELWMDAERDYYAIGVRGEDGGPSPLPAARITAALYFPELSSALIEFDVKAGAYRSWILEAARKRVANKGVSDIEGFSAVNSAYIDAAQALFNAMAAYAAAGKVRHIPSRSEGALSRIKHWASAGLPGRKI